MENYDGGIVRDYVSQFQQLGTKAQKGEDVSLLLPELVAKAREHIAIWKDGDPAKNQARLAGQLRMNAELSAQSSPAFAKALMDAAELLRSDASRD
jgi:hypothetical protein